MKYNFDKIIDRRGTSCVKYDFAAEHGMPENVLPLWVADMDFPVAEGIQERLMQAVNHGIFGYSNTKDDYFQAVYHWYDRYFNWQVEKEWMITTPGIVFAIAMAVRAFTKEGESVLIQQPVYHPFRNMILANGRNAVSSPLCLVDGHYEMDFEDFEKKIVENQVKLFILCSPHNPVGRVWKEWELRKVGEICRKHNVIVFSDEIHSDFVYGENKHHVFASLDPAFAEMSVIGTAPSKTFNIAGLQASNLFIPNPNLREQFQKTMAATGYGELNNMGMIACQAAYETGREWLEELKVYLWNNFLFLQKYLEEHIPGVRAIVPEGTYLVWVDFRGLGLSEEKIQDLIVNKAGLWLNCGTIFGAEGSGFERVNIACPRATLREALERLERAVKS